MRTTTEEEKCLSIREGKGRNRDATSSGTYRVRHRLIFLKKKQEIQRVFNPMLFLYIQRRKKKREKL